MQRLGDLDDDALAGWYAYPPQVSRGHVRANFVASLDGSATGDDGLSGSINNAADRRVFGLLRALADVVVVGAGTVRAEGYRSVRTRDMWRGLRAELALAPAPTLAVVSRSLDLPDALLTPHAGTGPVVVITVGGAEPHAVQRVRDRLGAGGLLIAGEQSLDIDEALEQLAGRGLRRILLEGGPHLMNLVTRAGRLDELCLTLSPLLVGGTGPRIAWGAPLDQRMALGHVLEADGVLLTRWLSA